MKRQGVLDRTHIANVLFVFGWLAVAAAATRVLLHPGIIYNHDWAWPSDTNQLWSSLFTNVGAWDSGGLGQPNFRPLIYPFYVLWLLAVLAHNAAIAIALLTWIALAGFSAGLYWCIRKVTVLSRVNAYILATAGMLGPAVVNKFAAGHIYDLAAIATVPWVLGLLFAPQMDIRKSALPAALLVATSVAQIQIFAVEFVMLASALAIRRPGKWDVAGISLLTAGSLAMPLIVVAGSPGIEQFTSRIVTGDAWLLNNSAPFPGALVQLGYASGYAEAALAAVPWFPVLPSLWLLFVFTLIGVFDFRKSLPWTIVFAACSLAVLGEYGPLGSIIAFVLDRSTYFNIFRELYDFAGVAWAAELVLAAFFLARLPAKWATLLGAVVLAGCASLWLTPDVAGHLATATPSSTFSAQLRELQGEKGDLRFLLQPSESPVGPIGKRSAGVDPSSYAVGNHPSAGQYVPVGPLEIASGLLRSGETEQAEAWLARAAVGKVIPEDWIQGYPSRRVPPIAALPVAMHARFSPVLSGRSLSLSGCMLCAYAAVRRVADPAGLSAGGDYLGPENAIRCRRWPLPSTFDPSRGWANAGTWAWLDPRLAILAMTDARAEVTWSPGVLDVPQCPGFSIELFVDRGQVVVEHRTLRSERPLIQRLPASHDLTVSVRSGIVALALVPSTDAGSPPTQTVPEPDSRLHYTWWAERGYGHVGPRTQWIILKQSFSPSWKLAVAAGRVVNHVVANGYANAWRIEAPTGSDIRVWYEPESTMLLLQVFGGLFWCVMAAYCFRKGLLAIGLLK